MVLDVHPSIKSLTPTWHSNYVWVLAHLSPPDLHEIALAQAQFSLKLAEICDHRLVISKYSVRHQQSIPDIGHGSDANILLSVTNCRFYTISTAESPDLMKILQSHRCFLNSDATQSNTPEQEQYAGGKTFKIL